MKYGNSSDACSLARPLQIRLQACGAVKKGRESDTVKQLLAEELIHFFSSRCYGCKRLINNSRLQDSGLFAGGRGSVRHIYPMQTAWLTQIDCLASPISRHISVVMWWLTSSPSGTYCALGDDGAHMATYSSDLEMELLWKLNASVPLAGGAALTVSADSWT